MNPEQWAARILRVGVAASASLILAGFALLLVTGETGYPPGHVPLSVAEVAEGLGRLAPYAVIDLGLILLIATPVLQVSSAILAFLVHGDRLYAGIATLVLVLLLTGIALGRLAR